MPRKERLAKKKEAKEEVKEGKPLKATMITPIKPDPEKVGKLFAEADEAFDTKTENNFQKLCFDISEALRTETGKKLNCRLRVLVEHRQAIVYQGLASNVWGRFRSDGRHQVYRHALKKLLTEFPKTAEVFKSI